MSKIKRNPKGKLFAVNLTLHLEAIDEDTAMTMASLYAARATAAIRSDNSNWVEDNVTLVQIGKERREITEAEFAAALKQGSYDWKHMVDTLGEEKAARWLTHEINRG